MAVSFPVGKQLPLRQFLLVLIAVLAVLGAVSQQLYGRVEAYLGGMQQEVVLAEKQLQHGIRTLQKRDLIEVEYARLEPYLKVSAGDDKQNIALLLREIERIVNVSGGTVGKLIPYEKVVEREDSREIKADCLIECSFPQLLEFLHAMQRSTLPIRFDSLTIIVRDQQADMLRVEGVVSFVEPR